MVRLLGDLFRFVRRILPFIITVASEDKRTNRVGLDLLLKGQSGEE